MSKETQNNEEIANNQFAEWETGETAFFENTTVVPETVVEAALKDDVVVTTETKEVPEKQETPAAKEDYVFDFGAETTTEEEVEATTTDEKSVKVKSKDTLEFLKEKGLVDYELEEGTELTDDLADEILEDNWDASIIAGVEETIKDLPDALKELIKYSAKGGDFTELLSKMTTQTVSGINKDTDMEVEANQVLAVSLDLKDQGYDQEYIDTQIEFLKDSGKLAGISKKAFEKKIAKQENDIQETVKQAEKRKEAEKEAQKTYKKDITVQISSLNDIKGLVLNKQDKEVLPSYISDANIKLQDGRTVTKFQQELFSIFGDKEQTILLAKLVKDKFDFSSITNKEITKFSKGIKEEIQNNQVIIKGSKGSSQQPKKSLAELLD
ncbi:hypothetical protein BOX09_gp13 [Flavobacterium phage Fpv1]|uniref:Uncharacterized protein n=2 Tax=Fipvunavirus Fpv1 TaxID=2560475 RepID=A0A1B0WLZ2_9CAUD|nr:hypothetical protein BOW81_gp13 [Flavobacterium phage Fpv20]YP_009322015.1 hypothetical protein BOX09_gp13 [Flavobacterium phage Fpv1]YP_009323604.1 hypothetical protein BOW82_gp13 [Flavobacterium phage Fpv2]ALN97259.1 hypothetical protein [Flavobacterium phage FpV21]QCW20243.1 hypothetical protein [Flavobacterium phage FPSV-F12]QCW20671.1 hypothetical protein [Flavobacterium phage FPSV-S29]ANB40255.1 hypothetical protein [Flavobacterium phage Fpv1]ANB40335.1 hypothetical protein [Flavoba